MNKVMMIGFVSNIDYGEDRIRNRMWVNFNLKVKKVIGNEEGYDYIRCESWGKKAKIMYDNLIDDGKIMVLGRLKISEDRPSIAVDEYEFL